MPLAHYDEVLEDDPRAARRLEQQAIVRAISLLQEARAEGIATLKTIEALQYLDRLWSLLLDDLVHAENRLPKEMRASLISIGLWILREIDDIRKERSQNLTGLIEILEMIAKGLG